jgi:glycosyltransferase involved in cell wall biosynthesis
VIHVVNPAVLGLGGLYYSQKFRIPLVASYHTHLPKYLQHYGLGFLEGLLWNLLKLGHNQARLNLCTSTAMVKELSEHGIERVQLWQRGVDTELFHPQAASVDMRQRLTQGKPDRPLLLYVGRLSAEKEVGRIRVILEKVPQACLAVVGDGPERGELEKHFAGYDVLFTGYLKGEALASAFASADLFVFPSRTETLGLVLLEAMAAGCPVVAPRSGGITDVVDSGRMKNLSRSLSRFSAIAIARMSFAKMLVKKRNAGVGLLRLNSSKTIIATLPKGSKFGESCGEINTCSERVSLFCNQASLYFGV